MKTVQLVLPTGCWVANRADNGHGYLSIDASTPTQRMNVYAHRLSYEEFVGPIPRGLEIDHKCRNRRCFYPPHLEAVTQLVNAQRGAAARRGTFEMPRVNWEENAKLLAAWVRRQKQ